MATIILLAWSLAWQVQGVYDGQEAYERGLQYERNKDEVAARAWYSIAADENHADAMYRLVEMLRHGRGGKQDYWRAVKMFGRARALKEGSGAGFDKYVKMIDVRCRSYSTSHPVDTRLSLSDPIYRSLEAYHDARDMMRQKVESMLNEATNWCSLHWSCYGLCYYDGPDDGLHVGHGLRPQFCTAALSTDELVSAEGWHLVLKLDDSGTTAAKQQSFTPSALVPARCSHAGYLTKCFNPRVCNEVRPERPYSWAFVLSHDLSNPLELKYEYLRHLCAYASLRQIDVVMLIPAEGLAAFPLDSSVRSQIEELGVKITERDWVMPDLGPGLNRFSQKSWCMSRDLFKLHALGLDQYDAIVYYDQDVLVVGQDIEKLFHCVSHGYLLASSLHGGFEALNLAFFAIKPDGKLLQAILDYLRKYATFNEQTGWDALGFGPWGCIDFDESSCLTSYHLCAESQGLLYNMFFVANPKFRKALSQANAVPPVAVMVDGCEWVHENSDVVRGHFQVSDPCVAHTDCDQIQAYHGAQLPRGCTSEAKLQNLPEVANVLMINRKSKHQLTKEARMIYE